MNKKNILLVDDELQLTEMMKMRLEANDYEVITAYDGQEALYRARREKPDLILLDLVIPKMNGYEICKRLKEDTYTSDIPIIIITASETEDLEEKCRAVGADDCAKKPYDSAELIARIKALIRN